MNNTDLCKIRDSIDKADQMYYRLGGKSIMTDAAYDALKLTLKAACPEDPRLKRVGQPYVDDMLRTKRTHTIPMGSLDNTDGGIDGFLPWYLNISESIGSEPSLMMSVKVDGSSVALYYKDGKLSHACSRGSGSVGEDITANAVMWTGVPLTLPQPIDIVVRGEAILYRDCFDEINEQEGVEDVSNPRNVGNGIIGRLDGHNNHYMAFLAFNWSYDSEIMVAGIEVLARDVYNTMDSGFELLASLGFNVVPHLHACTFEDGLEYYNKVAEQRDSLPFEIDGVVVFLNSLDDQENFITDEKSKLRPKFGRAIKFPVRSNATKIIGCNITIGHNGVLCPTAIVEEVRVGGVNVCNVNLNNWNANSDWPSAATVGIGDEVEVGLSGDVIPKCLSIINKNSTVSIEEPKVCPFCGGPTTRMLRGKTGAATYCAAFHSCPGAQSAAISHWIGTSKKGVGILNIGDGIIAAMIASGMVKDPADIYTLDVDALAKLVMSKGTKVGKSRATKIVKEIKDKSVMSLEKFLGSLGIDLLGRRRVELLRKAANGQLDSIDQWLDPVHLDKALSSVVGSGDITRVAICDGIARSTPLIRKLLQHCSITAPVSISNQSGRFSGLSFCFTGTRDLIKEVEAEGGLIKSGVSKGLHYLVQKDPTSTSNKTQKAEEYGVKVIGLDFLRGVINGQHHLP